MLYVDTPARKFVARWNESVVVDVYVDGDYALVVQGDGTFQALSEKVLFLWFKEKSDPEPFGPAEERVAEDLAEVREDCVPSDSKRLGDLEALVEELSKWVAAGAKPLAKSEAGAPLENNMVARLRADFEEEFKRHRSHSEKNEDRIAMWEKRVEALMGLMEVQKVDTGPEALGAKSDWVRVNDTVVGDFYRPAKTTVGCPALTPEEWKALPETHPEEPVMAEVKLGVKGDWKIIGDPVVGHFYRSEKCPELSLTPQEWEALPSDPTLSSKEVAVLDQIDANRKEAAEESAEKAADLLYGEPTRPSEEDMVSEKANPRERVVNPVAIVRAVRDDLLQQCFNVNGPLVGLCDTILEKLRKNFSEDRP